MPEENKSLQEIVFHWECCCDRKSTFSQDGLKTVSYFNSALPFEFIIDSINKSVLKIPDNNRLNERFRYFCGICWGKIKGKVSHKGISLEAIR
jgi:hypothetical protein